MKCYSHLALQTKTLASIVKGPAISHQRFYCSKPLFNSNSILRPDPTRPNYFCYNQKSKVLQPFLYVEIRLRLRVKFVLYFRELQNQIPYDRGAFKVPDSPRVLLKILSCANVGEGTIIMGPYARQFFYCSFRNKVSYNINFYRKHVSKYKSQIISL